MSELKPLPHVLGMMPSNFTSFQFGAKLKELYPDVYERNKANNMGKWLKQHAIHQGGFKWSKKPAKDQLNIQDYKDEIKSAPKISVDDFVQDYNNRNEQPNPDRSELYKLLPSTSQWPEWAKWVAIDNDGEVWYYEKNPKARENAPQWVERSDSGDIKLIKKITLPPSINWKDTLVSREELEAWEFLQKLESWGLLQKFEAAKPEPTAQPETLQAKVERLKAESERIQAELKQAEEELRKSEPIEIGDISTESIGKTLFIGRVLAPAELQQKCLMFDADSFRMEQQQHEADGINHTVLTFYRK